MKHSSGNTQAAQAVSTVQVGRAVSPARDLIHDALAAGEGIVRLAPCWVPRSFLMPGGRLKLDPRDLYALGAHRGGIDERWFSSTTKAANGPLTADDEGLSYIEFDGKKVLLKEAIDTAGDKFLGEDVMQKHGGWNLLCKFFDNLGPIPHHMHQNDEFAARVGQKGKPEAYYFPSQYNFKDNNFPYTFMGLNPGTKKDDIRRCLEKWNDGDNEILYLSRAYKLKPGTGWQVDPGILHAPGSLVTYEPQVNSDVFGMFQSMVEGRAVPWDLLVKDVPPEHHHDLDYLIEMLDWPANTDPDFSARHLFFPKPVSDEDAMHDAGYCEKWVVYSTPHYSARELTVFPGRTVTIKDAAAYGLILTSSYGTFGKHEVETPSLIRYGRMTRDELFVTADAAREGVKITNASQTENLVILKHFGPGEVGQAVGARSPRPVTAYLAFDLGAESGRAILGWLSHGALTLQDVARFPNNPIQLPGSLRWDVLRLYTEIRRVLDTPIGKLTSLGFDTWGVDYALIGEKGQLLENPYHYRDHRTDGVVEEICELIPRQRIYGITGIQFMPINTLCQLYAASKRTPRLLDAAEAIVTIPDLFNYWLTGNLGAEYTNATTTQFMNAKTRSWATELLEDLNLPTRLLPPIFEPGTTLGEFEGTPVVAPACHDTGSAVAAVATNGRAAFLSSGTWSLLGAEVRAPVMTPRALELNFTNEGGICGTTRLLKNIGGLWLLQSCRRCWADEGYEYTYDDLLYAASAETSEFTSLIDPDDPSFHHPDHMVTAIQDYCRRTDQLSPVTPGACTKAILESLAFKYAVVLEWLEELIGHRLDEIRIIGGGAKNRLLNQFTANATGRAVIAGPIEATALGNIAMQMLATGAVSSLADARAVIERSFPTERFEPHEDWSAPYSRFRQYVGQAVRPCQAFPCSSPSS